MENASKALIIAGAILLSILLISLGIMIFTQAQDTVNNNGMTQADLQAFNNKFLKYEGTKKGAEAKAVANEILASNADPNNSKKQVYFKVDDVLKTTTSDIDLSKSYTIQAFYVKGADTESAYNNIGPKGCIYLIKINVVS